MHNFKELKIWQVSRGLAKEVYVLTRDFPPDERFGMTSQLRRCVVSISSNIAEGSGRGTDKDFAQFLNISLASSYQLESLLLISLDLGIVSSDQLSTLLPKVTEIQLMTYALIKALRQTTTA